MEKQARNLLLTALLLAWSVDQLFYGKSLGISLLLFAALVTAALRWHGRSLGVISTRQHRWLLPPLFFFAAMAMVRDHAALTVLNVLAVLCLLAYLAFFYAAGRLSGVTAFGAALTPLRVAGASLYAGQPVAAAALAETQWRQNGRRHLLPFLRGGLFALPVLFVFTLLLTSADLVFADYVSDALNLEIVPTLVEWAWRALLILGLAWLLLGGLVYALSRSSTPEELSLLEKGVQWLPQHISLGFTEALVILGSVNALFFSFVLVQFTYLFGGERELARTGVTYAEYARRGFFELVLVAVLALSLILALNWITRRENKRQLRGFKLLGTMLIGLVLVLLTSAFVRMRLYEATFGYTWLRLMVYVFIFWLGALLLWFVASQWRWPDRFGVGLLVTAVAFLATLNLLNPDAFIVQQNLARYGRTGDIDIVYLTTLSHDATPQLIAALPQLAGDDQLLATPDCRPTRDVEWIPDPDVSPSLPACKATPHAILLENLARRQAAFTENEAAQAWPSFHLSRWRAARLLAQLPLPKLS